MLTDEIIQGEDEEIRKQILAILKDSQYDFDYGYGEVGVLNVRMVNRNKASYDLLNYFKKELTKTP